MVTSPNFESNLELKFCEQLGLSKIHCSFGQQWVKLRAVDTYYANVISQQRTFTLIFRVICLHSSAANCRNSDSNIWKYFEFLSSFCTKQSEQLIKMSSLLKKWKEATCFPWNKLQIWLISLEVFHVSCSELSLLVLCL